jgi:hypothetical protein
MRIIEDRGGRGSRELLMELVVAELIARPGEGPLAARFRRAWAPTAGAVEREVGVPLEPTPAEEP